MFQLIYLQLEWLRTFCYIRALPIFKPILQNTWLRETCEGEITTNWCTHEEIYEGMSVMRGIMSDQS